MGIELAVLDWIQVHLRCGALDTLAVFLSRICDHGEVWILLAAALLAFRRTRGIGAAVAAALLLDLVSCNMLLKPLIGRVRPFGVNGEIALLVGAPGDASFPSGHTASSFAAVWALRSAGSPLWRPGLVLAVCIALSRLYLYVHWPTDVLGGAALGVAAGWLGAKATKSLREQP